MGHTHSFFMVTCVLVCLCVVGERESVLTRRILQYFSEESLAFAFCIKTGVSVTGSDVTQPLLFSFFRMLAAATFAAAAVAPASLPAPPLAAAPDRSGHEPAPSVTSAALTSSPLAAPLAASVAAAAEP